MRLSGSDWERLGEDAPRLAHFIGNRAYMRLVDGHCAALDVRRGALAEGATVYFCSIYERRPETCRALERGSPQCLGELATKGERPEVGAS